MHRKGCGSRTVLLSVVNKIKRLKFVHERKDWKLDNWKQVAWADESHFPLPYADGQERIWGKLPECMDAKCIAAILQAGERQCDGFGNIFLA